MANTYTLIASSTAGSGGAAYIEFTSIPNTYTDLLVMLSLRTAGGGGGGGGSEGCGGAGRGGSGGGSGEDGGSIVTGKQIGRAHV